MSRRRINTMREAFGPPIGARPQVGICTALVTHLEAVHFLTPKA
jgi:hypothetical protein